MRISDWSSDVCSSDLVTNGAGAGNIVFRAGDAGEHLRITSTGTVQPGANASQDLGTSGTRWFTTFTNIVSAASSNLVLRTDAGEWRVSAEIGRASVRAGVCPYV